MILSKHSPGYHVQRRARWIEWPIKGGYRPVKKNKHGHHELTGGILSSRHKILAPLPPNHIAICQKRFAQ
jgi:hypothetical protein